MFNYKTELTNNGWKCQDGYKDQELWYKVFPNFPPCKLNDNTQVIVNVYKSRAGGANEVFEIELYAQKPDNLWIKLQVYTIDSESFSIPFLNQQVNEILLAWTAIYNNSAKTP